MQADLIDNQLTMNTKMLHKSTNPASILIAWKGKKPHYHIKRIILIMKEFGLEIIPIIKLAAFCNHSHCALFRVYFQILRKKLDGFSSIQCFQSRIEHNHCFLIIEK